MALNILLFIAGLAALILGGEALVRGASALAKMLSVPEIVIALSVVAFGTSSPELVVNIVAALEGHDSIVLGNVVGSNIFNIFLILGISSLIFPLSVDRNTVWREIPFALISAIVLLILLNVGLTPSPTLSRIDGIILLILFSTFIGYIFIISEIKFEHASSVNSHSGLKIAGLIFGGLIGLMAGGKLVVDSSVVIAEAAGISERIIALTIISGGTSLPELATSAIAAYRKKPDIAVGNIVGSNIFNILMILGVSSLIRPTLSPPGANLDIAVSIVASILLFVTMFTGKLRKIDRWEGILFLVLYCAYLIIILL